MLPLIAKLQKVIREKGIDCSTLPVTLDSIKNEVNQLKTKVSKLVSDAGNCREDGLDNMKQSLNNCRSEIENLLPRFQDCYKGHEHLVKKSQRDARSKYQTEHWAQERVRKGITAGGFQKEHSKWFVKLRRKMQLALQEPLEQHT